MKLLFSLTVFFLLTYATAFSHCPTMEEFISSTEYQLIISKASSSLDEQHKQGLAQIAQDIADLHSSLQTSSYASIENHPRITITGNWNQTCLVNLLTLIQNQGINRKLMNTAAVSSLKMTLDLLDPFLLPFKGFKSFLTSEAVEKAIFTAMQSDDPEAALWDEIKRLGKLNGTNVDDSPEADKLKTKMKHLLELYQLSQQNKDMPDDAKWHQWNFDPGTSTLDDMLSGIMDVDHTIFSQAMVRFGVTPTAENPVVNTGKEEGYLQQRLVIKGVADKPYPKNSSCKDQIKDYEMVIKNYGHIENKKYVSDYVAYEIHLNCCDEVEEEVVYEEKASTDKVSEDITYFHRGTESIGIIPGETYSFLLGGSIGAGRFSEDNFICAGINAQYFPDVAADTSGPHIGLGLQAKYAYQGDLDGNSNFWQTQIQVIPQALVYSSIMTDLHFICGFSFPLAYRKDVSKFDNQPGSYQSEHYSTGVALTTGLSLELKKWNVQVQTDLASYIRTTSSSPQNPGIETTVSEFAGGLNKGNMLNVSLNRRLGASRISR